MASYTTHYNIKKPTFFESADVLDVNANMDILDTAVYNVQNSIAPDFSSSSTYEVDDLVIYNSLLYRCTTAVTTAGAWNSANWTREYAVNTGGGGPADYSTTEQDTGVKWIDGSTIYRKVIDFGSLPQNTSKSVAHGISNIAYFTKIEAVAYEATYHYYLPIPFVDNGNSTNLRKSLYVDDTNVNIQTYNSDATDYKGFVILEYVKSSS